MPIREKEFASEVAECKRKAHFKFRLKHVPSLTSLYETSADVYLLDDEVFWLTLLHGHVF